MSRRYDLAIIGATGAVSELVLELLSERGFPIGELYVLARVPEHGATASSGDREVDVESLDSFDFARVHIAFLMPGMQLSEASLRAIKAASCVLIDLAGQFRDDPALALVVPEVNAELLADAGARHIVVNPDAMSIALALVLKPLLTAAGLLRLNIATYQAVSDQGGEAVEELAQQTRQLLTFQPLSQSVFPQQIAFNCLPQIGALDADGQTASERSVISSLRRLLDRPQLAISVTAVQVPVFYGQAAVLHLETQTRLPVADARARLSVAPGLSLTEDGSPSPVRDASGKDEVAVGRIRADPGLPNGLNLWLVTDNLRKGCALNAVQIAECLVQNYL